MRAAVWFHIMRPEEVLLPNGELWYDRLHKVLVLILEKRSIETPKITSWHSKLASRSTKSNKILSFYQKGCVQASKLRVTERISTSLAARKT